MLSVIPNTFGCNGGIITKVILKIFIINIFILFLQYGLFAQSSVSRPGIGLVLSGGGAKGIAHVGVLKVMEEAGLRPDYISGVSMGSIIGGMYSVGYKADTLRELLKSTDWDLILSNRITEDKIIYLEKGHYNNSIMSLPVSFSKVQLPSGLINGQQIENMLSFYAWPAALINDFSKLPIPFMCVATDILTFKKVDFKNGYLPDAIRASMAVPSIFTPLKKDTALLIDGGVLSNYAARELKDMGAEIIIGSYTGFHLHKEEDLQSLTDIMIQISMFRSINDYNEQKKIVDIIIEPELNDLSSWTFDNIDTLINRGYLAALPYKKTFRRLADSLNLISVQQPVKNLFDNRSYAFDRIDINGNKIYSDIQVLGVLNIRPGQKVDSHTMKDRIDLLYGKSWFEKVKYSITPRNDSLILVIECTESPKTMLYGSLHYDNSLQSGVIVGMSAKNLLIPRSVINIDSYLSQFYRFRFDYLQFINRNEKLGFSINFYGDKTLLPMMEFQGEIGDLVNRNYYAGLALNRILGLNHLISLSANIENMILSPDYVSDNRLKSQSYNYSSSTFNYQVNTLDTKHFPNRGLVFQLTMGTTKLFSGTVRSDTSKIAYYPDSPGDFSFDRSYSIRGHIKHYFSTDEKLSLAVSGDILLTFEDGSVSSPTNYYFLGGIESLNNRSIPMAGFHGNEIAVTKLAGIGAFFDLEIFENLHIDIMSNFFAIREIEKNKDLTVFSGYGAGIGYMSIIGPMKIGLMYGMPDRRRNINALKGYISIGFRF
jgi:NTE family protein